MIAGLLHYLGISIENESLHFNDSNRPSEFTTGTLSQICESLVPFMETKLDLDSNKLSKLSSYVRSRIRKGPKQNSLIMGAAPSYL